MRTRLSRPLGTLAPLSLALLSVGAIAAVVALTVNVLTAGATTQASGPSLGPLVDDATDGHRFSVARFEFEHVLGGFLADVGDWVTGRRDSDAEADAALERYFTNGAILRAGAVGAAGADASDGLREERDALENRVEQILEDRIGQALRDAGFARGLPLFSGQDLLWPPVEVELSRPPRVLALSPRDEIRLARTVLLDADLSDAEVQAIEAAVEAGGQFSAFVDTIGGVATYPAIVRDTRTYASTVRVAAHEWVHHYLFFYPLGAAYFDSQSLRTINETVADIVGDAIAAEVFRAHPNVAPDEPPTPSRADSDAVLRQLRLDVDALLAEGDIAGAEARMERVRGELAAMGRPLRRINQAFFAFNGVYAARATSTSPIGPALQSLRDAAPTLIDFVATVREFDTIADLLDPAPVP